MRRIVGSLWMTTLTILGCHDSTGPARREQMIYAIKVPQSAAVTDTIPISFDSGAGLCDTDVVVETQLVAAGVRFVLSSIPANRVCPITAIIRPFVYLVVPPHGAPFTASFAEPGEPDSVRVVALQ